MQFSAQSQDHLFSGDNPVLEYREQDFQHGKFSNPNHFLVQETYQTFKRKPLEHYVILNRFFQDFSPLCLPKIQV
ncbi:hypothetical protein chiPu_0001137 [Chiloscyllium punctatum]|uniref:Uncharacterized protein n=1 Tax=Chiloscyllium punctatum TaxID=137246 RepID=A0A401RX74_CHIPU|nr:hypothetical protein [Chiloscyllium punctatum]